MLTEFGNQTRQRLHLLSIASYWRGRRHFGQLFGLPLLFHVRHTDCTVCRLQQDFDLTFRYIATAQHQFVAGQQYIYPGITANAFLSFIRRAFLHDKSGTLPGYSGTGSVVHTGGVNSLCRESGDARVGSLLCYPLACHNDGLADIFTP